MNLIKGDKMKYSINIDQTTENLKRLKHAGIIFAQARNNLSAGARIYKNKNSDKIIPLLNIKD